MNFNISLLTWILSGAVCFISCTTRDGILGASAAGRGTLFIQEKNGLPARIFVDGFPAGAPAPALIDSLYPGRHTVTLMYAHYRMEQESVSVEVVEDRVTSVIIALRKSPASATCAFRSQPQGAWVILDGLHIGVTPLDLEGVPEGGHTVEFGKERYKPASMNVQASQGNDLVVNGILETDTAARRICIEEFSNTDCIGCPEKTRAMLGIIDKEFSGKVDLLTYHANWPNPSDPLFLPLADAVTWLVSRYAVAVLPAFFVNGKTVSSASNEALIANLRARIGADTASNLRYAIWPVRVAPGGGSVLIDALTGSAEQVVVRIALVQNLATFAAPPGKNGEKEFHRVVRGFFPSVQGSSVQFSESVRSARIDFAFDGGIWREDTMSVTVYIQNPDDKTIYQSADMEFPF
jgi:hypothetical protein